MGLHQAESISEDTATPTAGSFSTSLIARAVRMATGAAKLPAIATQSWCESAAEVLAELDPGAVAGVMLGRITSEGAVRDFEAAGVACSSASTAHPGESSLSELRWRLESMSSLGWSPAAFPDDCGSFGGALSHMVASRWRETPCGTLCHPFKPSDILVGVADIQGEVRDRRLFACVALPEQSFLLPGLTDVFLTILQQVGAAAVRAIGRQRPGRSIWITAKEQDVLDRLILGHSVREIAAELGRSPHTMHDHVKSLHRKLGATSRGDLIARALGFQRTLANGAQSRKPSAFELTEVRPKGSIATPIPHRVEA